MDKKIKLGKPYSQAQIITYININACKVCGKEITNGNWVMVCIPRTKNQEPAHYKKHMSC